MSNPPPPPPPPTSPGPGPGPGPVTVPTVVAPIDSTVGPPASPVPVGPSNLKIFSAEAIGVAVLMIVGPGSAIIALDAIGVFGVAFAFGLALLGMAYAIGHVSGCHINPAVTLGFWISRKITLGRAIWYWVAQFIGAFIGGLIIFIISDAGDKDATGVFAANGWGADIGSDFGLGATIVVEIFFTALLVFVVMSTTTVGYPAGFGGVAAGLTLAMIHLATIPVDNTSVNPARSFGTAIFSGVDALVQLWAFIIFPLIGAVLGILVWLLVHDERLEDTMFGGQQSLINARNRAAAAASRVEGSINQRLP